MPFNLDNESSSFWKVWKGGTHAQICAEILSDDEFITQASIEMTDPQKQADLVGKVVRMTGRRIGQEIARKGGSKIQRSIYSDTGSVYSILEPGTADSLRDEIVAHKRIAALLAKGDVDDVDDVVMLTSRMVGRAIGKKLGISFDVSKIIEIAKKIIKEIF